MENRSSFTIVGVFATICVVAIAWFIWWLTTMSSSNTEYKVYYIHTKELPNGLKEGSQVKYIGVPAGYVVDINFAPDSDYGLIEIMLKIQSDFPIKKDSFAKTEIQGLTGNVSLNLTKGSGESFKKGEKPIIYLDQGLLAKLNSKANDITEGVNEAIVRVNSLLSEENIKNFSSTLSSLESMISSLENGGGIESLNSTLASLDSILGSLDANKTEFSQTLAGLNDLMLSMSKFSKTSANTSVKLSKTLDTINAGFKDGNYNLKEILGPTLHETSLSLVELKKSLREFQRAMFRLEDNPYDFFFKDTSGGKNDRDRK